MNQLSPKAVKATSLIFAVVCIWITIPVHLFAQTINTIAGGNVTGDGGPAAGAVLNVPNNVAVDGNGNLYIAEADNGRIRKVSSDGVISTVAGNGILNYSGDGGPATNASLRSPFGVAVDGSGNLYVADTYNHRIRKVTPEGVISTVAGNGTAGYSGDGETATMAQIHNPFGVAVDADGNIYIADSYNHRIRKVSTGGIISTVAGNGVDSFGGDGGAATAASLYFPISITLDGSGNLYIVDRNNLRIRKVDAGGIIRTVAGNGTPGDSGDGGAATSAQFTNPRNVAVDGAGNLYIADADRYRVRKVSVGGIISTFAGNGVRDFGGDGGPATAAQLNAPFGVVVDGSSNLYIADFANNRIRKVSSAGIIGTVAGGGSSFYGGDGLTATLARLNRPSSVVTDQSGNLYIADDDNNRIRKVNAEGLISTVAGTGAPGYSGDGGTATNAQLYSPDGVATDGNGNFYIADPGNHRIRKVSAGGVISTVAGTGTAGYSGDGGDATAAKLNFPASVAVDNNGNLYIADGSNHRIRKVNAEGIISTIAGTGIAGFSGDRGAATSARLSSPTGVLLDGSNSLYIVDNNNHRVRKVNAEGLINTVAGNGVGGYSGDGGQATSAQLYNPWNVTLDGSGNLYIADYTNARIRKVTLGGIISTVAGNGTTGFSGDGGAAISAQLSGPRGVAVDEIGNIYIADSDNNRIRKVSPSPPASLSIGSTIPLAVCSASNFSLMAIATNFTPSSYTWISQPTGLSANGATPAFTAPTASVPTTYTVLVTASDGKTSLMASVTLTVNPQPVVGLSSGGTLTCAQTSVTLTASGANTYLFSGPGVVSQSVNIAIVNIAGTYSVTATGTNGCAAIQATEVSSNTSSSALSLSTNGPLSCFMTQVTLVVTSGFSSYTFSQGASQQGGILGNTALISSPGVYAVTATNAFGCQSSASVSVSYQNCPPRVENLISSQSATVNQAFSLIIPSNIFTDIETPNSVSLSVTGLPPGLAFTTPATISGTPTTTVGSPFSVTIVAIDPEGLTNSTMFQLVVNSQFAIIGVALVSCVEVAPTQRMIRFNPNYSGLNGQPISFSVVNELTSTTDPGPYQLTLNTDNPVTVLKALQQNSSGEASFNYNWLAACNNASCTEMFTVKAGNWNDSSVWSCGRVPTSTDVVTLSHAVSLPNGYSVQAQRINYSATGQLLLGANSRLEIRGN